jgi:hypothetical protein
MGAGLRTGSFVDVTAALRCADRGRALHTVG